MNSVSHNSDQGREDKGEVCGFTPLSKQKQDPKRKGQLPSIQLGDQRQHSGKFKDSS